MGNKASGLLSCASKPTGTHSGKFLHVRLLTLLGARDRKKNDKLPVGVSLRAVGPHQPTPRPTAM